MAKSDTKPEITLPGDRDEATRWIYARVKKLGAEKRWLSSAILEKLKDAKERQVDPLAVLEAVRIERMTPERRIAWERKMNAAAKMLGYTPLELIDMPNMSGPMGETVRAVAHLESERKDISTAINETYAAGKEAGIDIKSLRSFVRLAPLDNEDVANWFDALDQMGKVLGRWGANFDDLHETD